MDRERFDALARVLATTGSRRAALGALVGAGVLGAGLASDARGKKRNGKGRGGGGKDKDKARGKANRKDRKKRAQTEQLPGRCCSSGACIPGKRKNLGKCCLIEADLQDGNLSGANLGSANLTRANASGANFAGANMGKACLVDTNLTDATISDSTNLTGAIFCRTTMPDGFVNDSGCHRNPACCETCIEVDAACGAGIGGECCPGTDCCDDVCTDTQTDVDHCGSCGNACEATGAICRGGDCVVVVTPGNLRGWFFYNDETDVVDNSLGTFVNGPGNPPQGDGSAKISVTGSQRRNLATYQFSGTPLADITDLRFGTYNPSAGNGGSPNRSGYLHFNVDFNGSDTWQSRLVFVPEVNGTVIQNNWQEWDAIDGGAAQWSYSGAAWPAPFPGPSGAERSWAQLLSQYPGIRIRVTDAFLGIRVGEPYPNGYTENIDSLTFGVTAGGTTIYDFEPNS